ncbi:MAG: hypothetical protein QG655_57 [Actinomycetota bacterium]|jgi:hypothetical protein|nr:hypothetical protein [Actinomycetota bacterium]
MAPPANPAAALTAVRASTDPVAQIAQVTDDLDALIDVVAAWRDKVNSFVATGSDDDEVIATHDARGRLMELWVQPGLQQDMTSEEFEDAINDAIEGNTVRANEQFSKMADEFLAQFAAAPYTAMAQHPVADELSDALAKSSRKKR